MKCFFILAIFLAISVHTVVSQDPDTSNPQNETTTNNTDSNPPTGNSGNNTGNAENGTPETNNGTAPTAGDNANTTMSNAMKVQNVIGGLPAKCSNRYTACYGPDSTEDDIKNQVISTTDDDEVCELVEDGKDCVTTEKDTFVCTAEEYEKVQDQACSGLRSAVVNVVLIGLLSLISKILSQH